MAIAENIAPTIKNTNAELGGNAGVATSGIMLSIASPINKNVVAI